METEHWLMVLALIILMLFLGLIAIYVPLKEHKAKLMLEDYAEDFCEKNNWQYKGVSLDLNKFYCGNNSNLISTFEVIWVNHDSWGNREEIGGIR